MSHQVTNLVRERSFGSTPRKIIMLLLAGYASHAGVTVIGQERLAREAEMSIRSVRRILGDLADAGLIARRHRYDAEGQRTSDRTSLLLAVIESLPANRCSTTGQAVAANSSVLTSVEEEGFAEQLEFPPAVDEPAGHDSRVAETVDLEVSRRLAVRKGREILNLAKWRAATRADVTATMALSIEAEATLDPGASPQLLLERVLRPAEEPLRPVIVPLGCIACETFNSGSPGYVTDMGGNLIGYCECHPLSDARMAR